mmetsp:Transcript_5923/g.18705  ORF Transcript_5923/g.18705 Transcript_5923/m.18705 type:complete len:481 (+) Transcript_5923:953-2395(+)
MDRERFVKRHQEAREAAKRQAHTQEYDEACDLSLPKNYSSRLHALQDGAPENEDKRHEVRQEYVPEDPLDGGGGVTKIRADVVTLHPVKGDRADHAQGVAALHDVLCQGMGLVDGPHDAQAVHDLDLGARELLVCHQRQLLQIELPISEHGHALQGDNDLRHHVARLMLRDPLPQRLCGHQRRRHEKHQHRKFPVLGRHADRLGDAEPCIHRRRLHLGGLDADAVDLHLSVHAAEDLQPMRSPAAHISREVQLAKGLDDPELGQVGRGGAQELLLEAAEADLPPHARFRDQAACAVEKHDARVDLRLAHWCARGGRLASRPPGRHRRLARAVQVVEGDMRASFVEAPHKRHGQRGSDGGHVLEGPRATCCEVVQDLGQEGGRARERCGAVVPDELGHVRRVLLAARPRQDDLAAGDERREHLPLNHGPDNRRLHDGPASRIQLTSLGELRGPVHDAVVGVQDRLGAPGAPRSPHHDRARG